MVFGTPTAIIWYLTPASKSQLYELIPAFAVSFFATIVVSFLTSPPKETDAIMASTSDAQN